MTATILGGGSRMDIMGMAGNLFNYGMQQNASFAQMVQQMHSGQMPTAQNQWIDPNAAGGLMDPNSIQPGMGLGAGNIPVPPRESFTRFQTLQQTHKQEQETAFKDLEAEIDDRKEAFYERREETREQRLARRESERNQKRDLREQQEARKREFYARAQQAANSVNPSDPDSKAKLAEIQKQLEVEEQAMLRDMQGETLRVGLPNELNGDVQRGLDRMADLQDRHRREEESDPDHLAIQNYEAATKAFAEQQRAQLAGMQGNQFDPSAMGFNPNQLNQFGANGNFGANDFTPAGGFVNQGAPVDPNGQQIDV